MALLTSGEYVYDLTEEEYGDLPDGWLYEEAAAVTVDEDDNVYVWNRGQHSMIILDKNGAFIKSWGEGEFVAPHGVTMGLDGSVFCVDARGHTVDKRTRDGELIFRLGEQGKAKPQMSGEPFAPGPTDVGIDPRTGDFYVTDGYSNAKVHKYTPDGELQFSWGEPGTHPGQFCTVHNIGVDLDGYVYVCDRENQRVQIFDDKGAFQDQWVNMGPPTAVYVDNRGPESLVYVAETFGGLRANYMDLGNWTGKNLGPRVSIHDTKGNVLAELGENPEGLGPDQFSMPHGIAVDSEGSIYFGEVPWGQFGSIMDPPRRDLRCLRKLTKVSAPVAVGPAG